MHHPPPELGSNSWQIAWQLSDRKQACHPILSDDLITKLHERASGVLYLAPDPLPQKAHLLYWLTLGQ